MDNELFKRLVTTPGISGREERIRDVVKEEMGALVDEMKVDRLGNVLGYKHGDGPRVMLCAHMDSIGFLVRHIDDQGFLRISPVGGFDPRVLVMQRVLVYGDNESDDLVGILSPSEKPIHLLDSEERKKPPKMDDLFIDLMMPADEVKARVPIGAPVSYYREPIVTDTAVVSPYLDDRLCVYVMIEALRRVEKSKFEICAVASVQEEVRWRGALTSAFGVEPDIGVALDITIAADIPGSDESSRAMTLGAGTAVCVMDSMAISDPRLVKRFTEIAERDGINHQLEVLLGGGTDAAGIQLSRAGVPVITIGPPCRYVHTVNEAAYLSDIEASIDLLVGFLETAHDVDLAW